MGTTHAGEGSCMGGCSRLIRPLLFDCVIANELGAALFVFFAGDLSGGVALFEELQRGLEGTEGGAADRDHDVEENHP